MKEAALIFDLDGTLISATAVPDEAFSDLILAIETANRGAVPKDVLKQAFKEIKRTAIDTLAQKYKFSEAMVQAAREVLTTSSYDFELVPFPDYPVLRDLPGKKILVTSGVVNLQQAKIDTLSLARDFDEIVIDDIYAEVRAGKKEIFADLAKRYHLDPGSVWIVGDNPDSEIRSGNELGMVTVQRTSQWFPSTKEAAYVITGLEDLLPILRAALA